MPTTTLDETVANIRNAVTARLASLPADDPKRQGWASDAYAIEPPERPASLPFLELVEELRQLHLAKTAQYGTEDDPFANVTASAKCGVEPWRRALCDLSDCVVRLQRYACGQPVDVENAAMDAANWALICLLKMREAQIGSHVTGQFRARAD